VIDTLRTAPHRTAPHRTAEYEAELFGCGRHGQIVPVRDRVEFKYSGLMLDIDLGLDRTELRVIVPVVGALISFMIFWFAQSSTELRKKFLQRYGSDGGSVRFFLFTKVLGGFSMGALPLSAFLIVFPTSSLSELGLAIRLDTLSATILLIIGQCIVMIPIVSMSARKPKRLKRYPQIRSKRWDKSILTANVAAWTFYLVGYEILFRSVLLFPLVEAIGLWPSIAVNVGMYAGTHIPKGFDETVVTIPLSVILCLSTLLTGSILVAAVVHITMALTNSFVALRHHPEMRFIRK
jgi:membrane protease YdiL (CAAX protease family)